MDKLRKTVFRLSNIVIFTKDDFCTEKLSEDRIRNNFKYMLDRLKGIGVKFNPILLSFEPLIAKDIIDMLEEYYGKNLDFQNTTFYKDFEYVLNTPEEILKIQQLMHYITSYWIPSLEGTVDNPIDEMIYYPEREIRELDELLYDEQNEKLLKEIKFMSINEYIKLFKKVYLYSNKPMNDETMELVLEVVELMKENKIDISVDINNIVNRELFVRYVTKFSNSIDFSRMTPEQILRYIVYQLTGETLIINNNEFKNKLKYNSNPFSGQIKNTVLRMLTDVNLEEFAKHYKQKRKIWKIIERKIRPEKLSKKWKVVKDKFDYVRHHLKEVRTFDRIWKDLIQEKKYDDALRVICSSPNYFLQNITNLLNLNVPEDLIINTLTNITNNIDVDI